MGYIYVVGYIYVMKQFSGQFRILVYLLSSLVVARGESLVQFADGAELAQQPSDSTEFLNRWDKRYRLIDPDVGYSQRRLDRHYARAAAELKKAVVLGLPDYGLYYRLGFCYEKMGDYQRALDAYRNASKCLEGKPEEEFWEYYICFHIGQVNAKMGNYKEAATQFERALEIKADSAEVRNNLGYCYSKLYMKRRALLELERAVAINPQLGEAYLNMGVVQAELGHLEEAETSLREASASEPRLEGASHSLARVLIAGGREEEAEGELIKAVQDFPGDARAHMTLAKLYLNTGRRKEAGHEAALALALMPALKQDNQELLGSFQIEPSLSSPPSSTGAINEVKLLELAMRHSAKGDFKEAEDIYNRILEDNPRSAEAYSGLGYLNEFHEGVRYGDGFPAEKSITFYIKALEIQPDMSMAWFRLGNVYEKGGSYGKALEAYRRAKEITPAMKLTSYNSGICYSKLGKVEAAERQFLEVLELDPDFADAHFRLAVLYAEKRDYGKAVEEYKEVLRINPRDADAHFNLGQIYRGYAEKPEEAAEHFKAYVRLSPDAEDAAKAKRWIGELEDEVKYGR